MDLFQVVGVFRKSCRLTIRLVLPNAEFSRDVLFQIDVVHPFGDCRAQEHQPLLLGAGVFAAVGRGDR